jgi:type VI secretion system secreted protein Hcp
MPAAAAVDAFLKFDEISGQSASRPGWIEVNSFSWGVGRGIGSPMGGTADRESSAPSVSEIVVTKYVDKASPALSKCAATGCHYAKVILAVRKAGGGQAYQQYVLTNVMVSSYHVSSGGDNPTESLSLHFTKIEMQSTSTTGGGWAKPATSAQPPHPIRH